jgi:hypothetical protein
MERMKPQPTTEKVLVHDEESTNFPECHTAKLEKSWEALPPNSIFEVVVVGKCDR